MSSHFDPWTASQADAIAAERDFEGASPGPLAQFAAALEVTNLRAVCFRANGGAEVQRCLHICLAAKLLPPQWLSDESLRRYSFIANAELGSFDDAYGKPFPKGTQLAAVRARRRLKQVIHAHAWAMAGPDGDYSIGSDLFTDIGRKSDVNKSAAYVSELYYESLNEGKPNVADLRSRASLHERLPRISETS